MGDPRRFEGRVALVTGAAVGIGRATAELLASGGARVAVVDLDTERLGAVAAACGPESAAIGADLADPEQIRASVDAVLERCGAVDILVNNAGVTTDVPVFDLTVEEWHRMHAINLRATFLYVQAVGRAMVRWRTCYIGSPRPKTSPR